MTQFITTSAGPFEINFSVYDDIERAEWEGLFSRHGVEESATFVALDDNGEAVWGAGDSLESCVEDALRTPLGDTDAQEFLSSLVFSRIAG